jgi:hypothetical protein
MAENYENFRLAASVGRAEFLSKLTQLRVECRVPALPLAIDLVWEELLAKDACSSSSPTPPKSSHTLTTSFTGRRRRRGATADLTTSAALAGAVFVRSPTCDRGEPCHE